MYRNIITKLVIFSLILVSLTGCGMKKAFPKRDVKFNKFVESGGLKKDSDFKTRKRAEKELGI